MSNDDRSKKMPERMVCELYLDDDGDFLGYECHDPKHPPVMSTPDATEPYIRVDAVAKLAVEVVEARAEQARDAPGDDWSDLDIVAPAEGMPYVTKVFWKYKQGAER